MLSLRIFVVFVVILLAAVAINAADSKQRGAIVITLAGTTKLSSYFEWSCRSMDNAASFFDMLVFHESNVKVAELQCAPNVKLIDLGERGLSKLIAHKILRVNPEETPKYSDLQTVISEVLTHIPRLLVEIKPMTGHLFSEWLHEYSHWTYSDPDIVWGNVPAWISTADLSHFDIITMAKTLDAGRLFIRGQFALHRNTPRMNDLYKSLAYLKAETFAKSVASALGLIREGKHSSDSIYNTWFHSAEGWYSAVVMKSGVSVKIVGRGLDDFSKQPVIVYNKQLIRCPVSSTVTLSQCIDRVMNGPSDSASGVPGVRSVAGEAHWWLAGFNKSIADLPDLVPAKAETMHSSSKCNMQWLPTSLRYCVSTRSFDHSPNSKSNPHGVVSTKEKETEGATLVEPDHVDRRLERVGESYMESHSSLVPGEWWVNDEEAARRQIHYVSCMFHFRHWDDYASTGTRTVWPKSSSLSSKWTTADDKFGCMVLHITRDNVMAFESCDVALSTSFLPGPSRTRKNSRGSKRKNSGRLRGGEDRSEK